MVEANPTVSSADLVLDEVQIEISVCLGHSRATMAELSKLAIDDVLSLGSNLDDPVSLYIGQRLIAKGVLEELEEDAGTALGVRVTNVLQRRKGQA